MKNKGWLVLIGFVLFFVGVLSIVLSMIGVNFAIFSLIFETSGLISFIFYISLIIFGLLLVIIPNTNLSNDEEIVEQ